MKNTRNNSLSYHIERNFAMNETLLVFNSFPLADATFTAALALGYNAVTIIEDHTGIKHAVLLKPSLSDSICKTLVDLAFEELQRIN